MIAGLPIIAAMRKITHGFGCSLFTCAHTPYAPTANELISLIEEKILGHINHPSGQGNVTVDGGMDTHRNLVTLQGVIRNYYSCGLS